jgi:hypothetical protein
MKLLHFGGLEEQLRGAVARYEASRQDAVRKQEEEAECLVLGDWIIRNVESEHVRVPRIGTEQPQRVTENRDLVSPVTVVIQLGTNDLRRHGNLDYMVGDVYALVKRVSSNQFSYKWRN